MAKICPLCNEKNLGYDDKKLCCSGYKPMKDGKEWYNGGDCDFHINFKNKSFGTLKLQDVINIIDGNKVRNKNGDTIELDLTNTQYFTKIVKAEKAFTEL